MCVWASDRQEGTTHNIINEHTDDVMRQMQSITGVTIAKFIFHHYLFTAGWNPLSFSLNKIPAK